MWQRSPIASSRPFFFFFFAFWELWDSSPSGRGFLEFVPSLPSSMCEEGKTNESRKYLQCDIWLDRGFLLFSENVQLWHVFHNKVGSVMCFPILPSSQRRKLNWSLVALRKWTPCLAAVLCKPEFRFNTQYYWRFACNRFHISIHFT